MKVSVIVTTHNTERYLLKCMDSIFNQTLSDIEIIIADDAVNWKIKFQSIHPKTGT